MDEDGGGGSRWRKGTTEWEKLHDVVSLRTVYIYFIINHWHVICACTSMAPWSGIANTLN